MEPTDIAITSPISKTASAWAMLSLNTKGIVSLASLVPMQAFSPKRLSLAVLLQATNTGVRIRPGKWEQGY